MGPILHFSYDQSQLGSVPTIFQGVLIWAPITSGGLFPLEHLLLTAMRSDNLPWTLPHRLSTGGVSLQGGMFVNEGHETSQDSL